MLRNLEALVTKFYKIPFLEPYWNGETKVLSGCFLGGSLVDGDAVEKFEKKYEERFNFKKVVGTSSGRTAIQIALEVLPQTKRGEVIVPSFGCTGTVQPVIQAGFTPVFADIGEDLNIDPSSLEEKITQKTRAVIIPSLCGKPANWKEIAKITKKHNLFVIDDASQSLGAKYGGRCSGSLGDAGIFSFTLGKILSATGGGALMTNNDKFAEKISRKRLEKENWPEVSTRAAEILLRGKYRKYTLPLFAARYALREKFAVQKRDYSFKKARISNIDAAMASLQLDKLNEIVQKRRRNAKILHDELDKIPEIELPEHSKERVFTKYIITFKSTKQNGPRPPLRWGPVVDFVRFLARKGIETEWSYIPLHLREPFKKYGGDRLPRTEKLWWRLITLPVNPNLDEEQMKYLGRTARAYFTQKKA